MSMITQPAATYFPPRSSEVQQVGSSGPEAPSGQSTWEAGRQFIKDGMEKAKETIREASARDGEAQGGKASPEVKAKPPEKTVSNEMSPEAKAAMEDLRGKTTSELQRMVGQGRLPAAVASDPVAMLELNQRFQDFNRMITLISNMMQAEHETLMAIIRNFKA